MARDWESSFSSWSQPPGKTEQDKSDNAERAIRDAIVDGGALQERNVSVFPQGSYRNRTNIRTESDVDIAIRSRSTFFFNLADGLQVADLGIRPASYSYAQYKADVASALTDHFGAAHVTRGKKAFDVHENTYRVDADALACFEYRFYYPNGTHREGVAFVPDGGRMVYNYPEQSYANGVKKNDDTGRRFKALVRVLKTLRSEMSDNGVDIAKQMPSFLIESLVWNVPNEGFGHQTFRADVRHVLAHLFNNTMADEQCKDWREINGHKYLFRSTQPWTRGAVHTFMDTAWNYVGFE
jgi:hypothetical protein